MTTPDLDALTAAAVSAFAVLRRSSAGDRARWLGAIADAVDAAAPELVEIAAAETHLTTERLIGEVARTTGQLRLFGRVVQEGSYLEATIDRADPDATPPTPDLRRLLVPLGPVAVFSASNFPFAFSVVGGDTASALAAGNPVIVKAHSGHPRLSVRTAEVAIAALDAAGAPAGTLALVEGRAAGTALVQHPAITAVGFTGSLSGGRALFDLAVGRPDPIPFYGELGSVNPVIVTPGADRARAAQLAAGLAGSFQLGLGQFCTKPGIVLVPRESELEGALVAAVADPAHGTLLTESITASFHAGVTEAIAHPEVRPLVGEAATAGPAHAVVAATTAAAVLAHPDLLEERFGPFTLLVGYDDLDQALEVVSRLGGSLTATLHAEPGEATPRLVDALTARAGRVLFSGWPTGVAVTWSQHHGGPWPATTSVHTSVGATAIRRFLRPVAYQSAPAEALPAELRDENALGIPRRVDGTLVIR